jgi:hypothetical protein
MLLGHWHHCAAVGPALATHLHGRELAVERAGEPAPWHWRVTSPHGALLAEGDAASCEAAEEAAEREALAVHPPTEELLRLLLA